eukprot:5308726-Prymnesium_polylepis.1
MQTPRSIFVQEYPRAGGARARGAVVVALVDDGEGDAFGCVRLLLTQLAAALHVEPQRQAQGG